MKACRVIKIIAFIIALLLTAVTVAGNVLIIRDSCVYYTDAESDTKVSVSTILEDLQGQKFRILPASANAEGEAPAVADSDLEIKSTDEPAVTPEATAPAAEDFSAVTPEATVPPTEDVTVAPEATATEQPVETTETSEASKKVYSIENHHYLLISLMKAGSARVDLGFMKCLNDVKIFGATILSDVNYSVNLCALIAFCLFFVAFILHLISKNVTKTFYGIMLMILGYLLFVVFVFAGVVVSSKVYQLCEQTFEAYDKYLARLYTVTGFIAVGILFGLPYFRCGSRQMKMKEMKDRIKKLRRKSAR